MYLLAISLAAALPDGLFEQPAMFCVLGENLGFGAAGLGG